MSNRFSDAMSKLSVEGSRTSFGRPPASPGNKRNSGLDAAQINAMFPDAAAAIAQKKAEYVQQTGNAPPSNRNSAAFGGDRNSYVAPTISAPIENQKESNAQSATSWRRTDDQPAPISRPKSSSGQQQGQQPMGHFSQPQSSGGLRSPRPFGTGTGNIQTTNLNAPENLNPDMPALSPYQPGGSWASMTNTPMVSSFNQQPPTNADMIANATAMKLAALSTVNNRIALDDVKKYRRARSPGDAQHTVPVGQPAISNTGIPGVNTIVVNESGQILNAQQLAALQAQQQAAMAGRRSRPNSPGLAMGGGLGAAQMGFASPQNNGFLTAYDGTPMVNNGGLGGMMGQFGMAGGGHEGYLSDHSEAHRGRSPRGRRGSSKPPDDPTDLKLLNDIPAWLRSLRLHKYTEQLKDLSWKDLVEMDDKALEARGVNALGARNKMLKVSSTPTSLENWTDVCSLQTFEQVREAKNEGRIPS